MTIRTWRVGVLGVIASVVICAADKVVGGPFVVNVASRTGTIGWIVQTGQARVQIPAAPQKAAYTKVSPVLKVEYTGLSALQPNTRYDYEAGGLKGHFKTPPIGQEPYNFVLYGDVRTRHDIHRRVIAQILKHGIPDFVVHSGDLVENGKDSSLWANYFDIERDLLRQTVFFPSLGNHERNASEFYDFFQIRTPYYSFNWGNAHFAVLDSDINNVSATKTARDAFWAAQTKWLEEDLAANQKAEYRFIVAHHAPFTAVERRQGDNPHMIALTALLERQKVTAGLFGHDHNYQHYLKNGIHYIVSGGGGAPLYDVNKPDPAITRKVASVENFVAVSVNGKTAKVQAIDINGAVIDEFEFKGTAPPVEPTSGK